MAFPPDPENQAQSHLTMDPPTNVKPPPQPLHNFTFKGLKWSSNSANHQHYHRVRKPGGESSRKPPLPPRNSGSGERSEKLGKEKTLNGVSGEKSERLEKERRLRAVSGEKSEKLENERRLNAVSGEKSQKLEKERRLNGVSGEKSEKLEKERRLNAVSRVKSEKSEKEKRLNAVSGEKSEKSEKEKRLNAVSGEKSEKSEKEKKANDFSDQKSEKLEKKKLSDASDEKSGKLEKKKNKLNNASDGKSEKLAKKRNKLNDASDEMNEKLEKKKKMLNDAPDEKSERLEKEKKPNGDDVVVEDADKKSKLFIRIRAKSKDTDVSDNADDKVPGAEDSFEPEHKVWNLRPRELITKKKRNANAVSGGANTGSEKKSGGAVNIGHGSAVTLETKDGSEKKGKGKGKGKEKIADFSISLNKDEIAEDIYALTGSKPSRKPKKRAKLVQNQLDCLFPGMWLSSITSETYKVNESNQNMKG
ncbi:hypothetical protein K2173_011277 [Erythroxylum novogranatense]|uniref:Uncharacterized protein n=1 Tax=Erythroxylum novogranatense TaxID=1862640 RepID=A0AAV8S9I8_9ROSI|nr:hypothetical protein K2173_011277 [Erythroxylum novogranatense]